MTTSADQGALAEVGSPVLIARDAVDARAPWRWQTAAIATATALLLMFNAHAVLGWVDELTPGPATEWLRRPITGWADATAAAGLDAPRAGMHARWAKVRALRFGDEQPGEQGAAAATD